MSGVKNERKLSVNVDDYPEHLNPFSEEDNHRRLKFWTLGRPKGRSNSFSMAGLKDFRNTWNFKSFTKKGRRELQEKNNPQTIYSNIPSESPIEYRKPMNETSGSTLPRERTPSTPQVNDYVYKGSVTPLPRFRFQERGSIGDNRLVDENLSPRIRQRTTSTTSNPAPYLTNLNESKVEIRGSRVSLQSQFEDGPYSSIRASARKKRRAPPPPPLRVSSISIAPYITVTDPSENTTKFTVTSIPLKSDPSDKVIENIEEIQPFLNVELKIVEEDDKEHKEAISNIHDEPSIDSNQAIETTIETKLVLTESDFNHISDKTTDTYQTPPDLNFAKTTTDPENIELNISKNSGDSGHDSIEKAQVEIKENVKENIQNLENPETTLIIELRNKPNSLIKFPMASISELVKDEKPVSNKIAAKMAEYERDVQYLTRSLSIQSDTDNVFSKVDVIAYKRRQSLPVTQTGSNIIENFQLPLKTNIEESSESISHTADADQSQLVKCKLYNHENSRSSNLRARHDFFDTVVKNEGYSNDTEENKEETNNYKRTSVANMKILFDTRSGSDSAISSNTSIGSPNPLPKPRRSKPLSNKSPSSESFQFKSCPISPIPNKTFSDRL